MWWPTQLMMVLGMYKELVKDACEKLYKPETYQPWWEKK
jgi:hypothetical protein